MATALKGVYMDPATASPVKYSTSALEQMGGDQPALELTGRRRQAPTSWLRRPSASTRQAAEGRPQKPSRWTRWEALSPPWTPAPYSALTLALGRWLPVVGGGEAHWRWTSLKVGGHRPDGRQTGCCKGEGKHLCHSYTLGNDVSK